MDYFQTIECVAAMCKYNMLDIRCGLPRISADSRGACTQYEPLPYEDKKLIEALEEKQELFIINEKSKEEYRVHLNEVMTFFGLELADRVIREKVEAGINPYLE